MTFLLNDLAPFLIKERERIKLFNQFFTDDDAAPYASTQELVTLLVFICNIRRTADEARLCVGRPASLTAMA